MSDGDRATQDHTTLLTLTQNPADRLWRYPLCHATVGPFVRSRLTPMHVTTAHTVAGVSAAALVLVGSPLALAGAGALIELRAILDCFDGVLARAQKSSSLHGRAMDQLGDTVSFVALVFACCWHLGRVAHPAVAAATFFLALLVSATSTACWDIYRRRYSSMLSHGRDEVEDEFVQLMRDRRKKGGVAFWVSSVIARFQLAVFHPTASRDLAARAALDADPPEHESAPPSPLAMKLRALAARNDADLRRSLRVVGLTGADSVNFIVGASILFGYVVPGLLLGMAYALVSLLVAAAVSNRVLTTRDL